AGLATGLHQRPAVGTGAATGRARAGQGGQEAHPRTGARATAQGQGAGRSGGDPGAAKKAQCLLGKRQRGQLTSLPERQQFVDGLNEAVAAGARKTVACDELGISLRTLQRWTKEDVMRADARTTTQRPTPHNALSLAERDAILAVCNSTRTCRPARSCRGWRIRGATWPRNRPFTVSCAPPISSIAGAEASRPAR